MRRTEKQIETRAEIDAIIRGCQVCRLALSLHDEPYLVPVSFGYDGEAIYFHTAPEGRKLDILAHNRQVCFEFERNVRLVKHATNACRWSFAFESVIGSGRVVELRTERDKQEGLNRIMIHYSGEEWPLKPGAVDATRVWKIVIDEIAGKRAGKKRA